MKNKKYIAKSFGMALLFSASYFLILLITIFLVAIGVIFLATIGILNDEEVSRFPLFMMALVSLIIGTVLSLIFSRIPLSLLYKIIEATNKIADGDYSVRLNLKGPTEMRKLNTSFNHMAEELGSVEMLRTDFVNNFSHEFKTPIVSIRGFAKMLKKGGLTDEERTEYLDIIISESERLSELSMNVLNLSKIEQQSILTDKKRFNLSEQIRLVIVMLYSKWDKKHIDIDFECGEIYYNGNAELLKQIWINLLDNAIKFSIEYGTIKVEISQSDVETSVCITDEGKGISDEQKAYIFDKFYQGDSSHSTKGNGLGLAIAKRVAELHGGEILVRDNDTSGTIFEVKLSQTENEV